jgi:amidase
MQTYTAEQSGAFVERFRLTPTKPGPLDGLTFAVKDLIDIAGRTTGCGNPTWHATHPPASVHAICVEQLLAAGATCIGKTVTDEIAFSLLGENHFHGTPLNPAAPDRVTGGSSSGSASAVACGLADLALGTDTGGSVRIPASNCGVFGLRPSHGIISVAGVMPLAPTLDTVGIFARELAVLERAATVLLPIESCATRRFDETSTIHLVCEAFQWVDEEVRDALSYSVDRLRQQFPDRVRESSLAELCDDERAADPMTWLTIYRVLQGTEMMSCLGPWIANSNASFGPAPTAGLEFVKRIDRTRINDTVHLRELLFGRLNSSLAGGDLLCLPSAPAVAPLKGSKAYDRSSDYYQRTLSLTAVAGACRLPQISLPVGNVAGVPIGLSVAAAYRHDRHLVSIAQRVLSS